MKPITDQAGSLFERIDHIIDIRNDIVHAGAIDHTFSDEIISQCKKDFIEAVDRIYHCLGDYYKIQLSEDY